MGMERGSETIDNAGYPDTEFCARDRWEGRPQTSPPRVHGRPPSDGDDHHRHGSGGFGSGGQGIGSSENGYSVPRGGGSHGEERGEGRVIGRGSGRDDRHVSRDGPMHEVSWDGDEDDAMFGHMTPCWRLLEKAQRYMDDVSCVLLCYVWGASTRITKRKRLMIASSGNLVDSVHSIA